MFLDRQNEGIAMLKRILIGVNGTQYSRSAVDIAVALASRHQASVIGLAVVDLPHLTAPQPIPLGGSGYKAERDEIVLDNARTAASRLLAEFSTVAAAAGVPSQSLQLEGDPVTLLAAQAQQADLLVVGRKSEQPELGVPTSRVLRDLLHQTTRPVLCVPQAAPKDGAVLVAYDGSPQAAKTLQAFLHLNLAAERATHILTVVRSPADREHAAHAVSYLQLHGRSAHLHLDSSGAPPAKVILEAAARHGAGMIVLGAFGQPALKEFFFGSVTKSLLDQSRVPLFLFH
jgi:nucleotide-binding universal stress UspA family protein